MKRKTKAYTPIIILLSITIPLVIAVLYVIPRSGVPSQSFDFLPLLNATLNGTAFLLLLIAFWAIKNRKIKLHRTLMWTTLILSALFLISYLLYHALHGDTHFGGIGVIKYLYFFILITHIVLSAAIVPLALFTLSRALTKRFDKHKKIARITLPIWLYVTLTGVIIYFMLLPYY